MTGSDPAPVRGVESARRAGLTTALRVALGVWLVWSVGLALVAPELSRLCTITSAAILVVTLWHPAWGLVATTAVVPAGALYAAAPARAAELFVWAFLAGWLLRVWRPLSAESWPRAIVVPAWLYGAALAASWLSLTVAGAAGVSWTALPQFLFRSIPADHLIFSGPEAETWTLLQSVAGLSLFLAAVGITREHPRSVQSLAHAFAGTIAVLAVATPIEVGRQWASMGYAEWFLTRFTERGERFAVHMADVNAAGSLYVMAGAIAAAHVVLRGKHRGLWAVVLGVLAPAFWLAGSRSSYLGIAGGLAVLSAAQRRWIPKRSRALAGAAVLLAVVIATAMMMPPGPAGGQGGVRESASLRAQFLTTSVRMFASSPLLGVGVGRYFDRSADYMTPELRALYGNENAHNYFAQQFSELGLAGGLSFLWLIGAGLWAGWRALRDSPTNAPVLALVAGAGGYLLTCMSGHPLLVPEAALPFWAMFGAIAGTCRQPAAAGASRLLALIVSGVLAAGVGGATIAYARVTEPPPDSGFHGLETAPDDTPFRWMTRHSVTYIPDGPGFLRVRLRAPDQPTARPLVIETSIAGRLADRRQLRPGERTTMEIPTQPTGMPFRRVDFRVNQVWSEEVRLGQRTARRPITVMAEDIAWMPLR